VSRSTIGYQTLTFEVEADSSLLRWLEEFFPNTSLDPISQESVWRVRVNHGSARPEGAPMGTQQGFTFDGRFSEHRATKDEHGRWWIADATEALAYLLDRRERTVDIISQASESPTRVAVLRVVRELATTACLRDGQLPIHGAAFARNDGSAVMVCGPKGAGKSSLLVHALRSGATYLANDRMMLEPAVPFVTHGMPTIVSLRPGMLDLFEGLKAKLEHHHMRSPDGSVWLTPTKFRRLFDAPKLERAPLGLLLFPRVDTSLRGLRFERLPRDHCASALAENLLRASDPIQSSEVFKLGEKREVLESRFATDVCRMVAREVPAFRCVVGLESFDTPPQWPA